MNIIFFGPPASGKGTQCKRLIERGFTHLSTGDMLRQAIMLQTKVGKEAERRIAQGFYVNDDIAIDLIKWGVRNGGDFIFDGFPRTIVQAKALTEIVDVSVVFAFEIDDTEALLARMAKRFEEEGREDDNPETFIRRLEKYRNETAPVLTFYEGRPERVVVLNANRSVEEVAGDIEDVLSAL